MARSLDAWASVRVGTMRRRFLLLPLVLLWGCEEGSSSGPVQEPPGLGDALGSEEGDDPRAFDPAQWHVHQAGPFTGA